MNLDEGNGGSASGGHERAIHRRLAGARREERVDVVHGHQVSDPYRWLEDVESAEVRAWIADQNALTNAYLDANPHYAALKARLTELWTTDACGVPIRRGERLFYTYREGLANQPRLLWQDGLQGQPRVALDPNTLADDGGISLTSWEPSPDGRYLALGLSEGGSDWLVWRVFDTAGGSMAADEVRWAKFSVASWLPDSSGFFYGRYDAPIEGKALKHTNFHQQLYLHRLGTEQADDRLILKSDEHPDWGFRSQVTKDGLHLVVNIWKGSHRENAHRIARLDELLAMEGAATPEETGPDAVFRALFDDFTALYALIAAVDDRLIFLTDHEAPNGQLVAVDLRKMGWSTLVPESSGVLVEAAVCGGQIITMRLHHAQSVIERYSMDGDPLGSVALPASGTASMLSASVADADLFFQFSSYSRPIGAYRLVPASGVVEPFRPATLAYDPARFITEQVFVTSKDGTQVPMFLSYRDGLRRDGAQPTCLYGYGGFGGTMTPAFSAGALAWMERGGIYAVAGLRGGSEYGKHWHLAGTKHQKQNVFDDFIACAEWLESARITNAEHLAIYGGSNGGLLVGACLAQRPELFAACVSAVGVLDMMRFHLFTIGWAWVSDYGSPDDPEMVGPLLAYSPYHNLKPGTAYPATLITTGDHDDRVFPAHSLKFAAALQHAQGGPKPILLRVTSRAGHGAGKPTAKLIDEGAALWAFLADQLGVEPPTAA